MGRSAPIERPVASAVTASPVAEEEASGDGWTLAAICLASLIGFLLASALSPFFPLIARDLGISVPLLGQIPALSMLAAAALGLVVGPLADQYGYRRLLLLGTLAVACSAVGTALAPTFSLLLLAVLLAAVSRAISQPVALAIAGTRFAGRARQRAVSWVVAAVAGAPVVGVPILTTIGGALGWRAAFAVLAVLAIVGLALVARALPPDAARGGARPSVAAVLAAYRPLARHAPTLGLVGASLLRSSAAWGWFSYYGAYLVERRGLDVQGAGWAYTGMGLGYLVGSLIAGRRLATLPPRPLLIATVLMQGVLLALPVFAPGSVLIVVGLTSAAAILMGIGNVVGTLALTRESPAGRATTMTLQQGAFSVGSAVGGGLGGLLLAVLGYAAIAASAPILCTAAAALVWWSSPRRA